MPISLPLLLGMQGSLLLKTPFYSFLFGENEKPLAGPYHWHSSIFPEALSGQFGCFSFIIAMFSSAHPTAGGKCSRGNFQSLGSEIGMVQNLHDWCHWVGDFPSFFLSGCLLGSWLLKIAQRYGVLSCMVRTNFKLVKWATSCLPTTLGISVLLMPEGGLQCGGGRFYENDEINPAVYVWDQGDLGKVLSVDRMLQCTKATSLQNETSSFWTWLTLKAKNPWIAFFLFFVPLPNLMTFSWRPFLDASQPWCVQV